MVISKNMLVEQLGTMTLDELQELNREVSRHIEISMGKRKEEGIRKVRELCVQMGLSAKDIFIGKFSEAGTGHYGKPRGKVAPKYRDPATGQTWTGRGKTPRWLQDKNRDDFLIAR
jgi:DNA-binding protein H-NS